ncbi:MAG: hypothetical protein MJ186_07165 [Clostridia bacterium]|nr:hypothetical protein [Clostridia bacterium]
MGLREDLYTIVDDIFKAGGGIGDPNTFQQRVEAAYRANSLAEASSLKYDSEKAMTEVLQKADPNYRVFNREKMQLQKENRHRFFNRVLEAECTIAIDPVARAMKEREPNSRVVTAYAAYARAALPEESKELLDSITALYNTKPRPDDYFEKLVPLTSQLKEMIHKDIAKNAVAFEKELSQDITDEELYEKWPLWRAKIALCSEIQGFEKLIPEEGYDGMSRQQIRSACDNIMSLDMIINNRMSFLASDCAGLIDYGEAIKINGDHLIRQIDYETPCAQISGLSYIGSMLTMARQNLSKNVSLKHSLSGNPHFICQTMDGEVFDLSDFRAHEAILVNKEPVFMMPLGVPDAEPTLVMPTNAYGANLLDEDAAKAEIGEKPIAPEEPDLVPDMPVNTASGLAKFWDSICKAIGLESLRPESCKQFDADMAEYDAAVAERDKYNIEYIAYKKANNGYYQRSNVIENTKAYLSPEMKNQARENMIQKKFGKSAEEYNRELREAAAEEARKQAELEKENRKNAEKRAFRTEMTKIKGDFKNEINASDTRLNKNLLLKANALANNRREQLLDVDFSDPKAAADALGTALAVHVMDTAARNSLKDDKYTIVMDQIDMLNSDGDGPEKFIEEVKKLDFTKIASKMSQEELKEACNPRRDLKAGVILNKIWAETFGRSSQKSEEAPQVDLNKSIESREKGKDEQELKVPSNQDAPSIG